MEEIMIIEQSKISGQFPLTAMPAVEETETYSDYEITVTYSVTPEENYAGPPGVVPPKEQETS
jgi:hypothetical protein